MSNNNEYVIAVDLGGTNLRCAIVDKNYTIKKYATRLTHAYLETEKIIENIIENIAEIINCSGLNISDIYGIGIGSPGIVNPDDGVIHKAANFPHFKNVPIANMVKKKFNVPTVLGHDVDLATLAESQFGAGRGLNHIVCVMLGTGIGMGMILNGQLYCGANAGAGNLGHMIMDKNISIDQVQQSGILEKIVSAPAIQDRAIALIKQGNKSKLVEICGGEVERIDARMVFEAANDGDVLSLRIVNEVVMVLGIGIANVINLLNPEIVIIGGGLAHAGDALFQPLVESIKNYVYDAPNLESIIVPSQLGDNAVLMGAAYIVWSSVTGDIKNT